MIKAGIGSSTNTDSTEAVKEASLMPESKKPIGF